MDLQIKLLLRALHAQFHSLPLAELKHCFHDLLAVGYGRVVHRHNQVALYHAGFLRAEPGTPASTVDTEPLWWPPAKIVGRHLAPFLAAHLGLSDVLPDAARGDAIPIEVELTPWRHGIWAEV